MRASRASLTAILPLLVAAAAVAQVPAGQPGFDVVGRWAPGAPAALVLDGRLAYVGHGAPLEAVSWPGDDDTGRPVPSGVYLVQTKVSGCTGTTRVTVVR